MYLLYVYNQVACLRGSIEVACLRGSIEVACLIHDYLYNKVSMVTLDEHARFT
jgi:hypothetical protein